MSPPMDLFFELQEPPATPATPGEGTGEDPGQQTGFGGNLWIMLIMFAVMFWFLMGGQRKEKKRRELMLANLKRNDHVVTTGGILGVVDKIKDNEVTVKIDEKKDIRIRVVRAAIAYVKGDTAEPDKPGADDEQAKKEQ